MKYPQIVLKNSRAALDEVRRENRRISHQKRAEIYKKATKLQIVNKNIASLIKSVLHNGADSGEIKDGITNLINTRNSILTACGLPLNSLEDYHSCEMCGDDGFLEDGHLCDCYLKIIRDETYKLSNLNEKIKTENFDTFNKKLLENNREFEFIYNTVIQFCENLKNPGKFEKIKDNLIFTGSTGTGKTFLSSCAAKYFLDNGKTVSYHSATSLCNLIDDAKFKKENRQSDGYLEFLTDCDLLIIDDLGTEFQFPYSQSQFFDILEARLTNGKKNVISSNLTLEDLSRKYSPRFVSRVLGNFEILVFSGNDLRLPVL